MNADEKHAYKVIEAFWGSDFTKLLQGLENLLTEFNPNYKRKNKSRRRFIQAAKKIKV